MDLYIQVGVILLFLAALSLFVYFYTQPAQQFTEGINDTTKELNQRLETASGINLNQYLLNTNVSGAQIKKLIQDAEASKIGVLVHTKAQKGLIVNYGYQLRRADTVIAQMLPSGSSGPVANEFEKNFVTSIDTLLSTRVIPSDGSITEIKLGDYTENDMHVFYKRIHDIATDAGMNENPTGLPRSIQYPTIEVVAPLETFKDVYAKGDYSVNTGLLYTIDTLKENFEINKNNSYIENKNSVYYVNDTTKFITTLVVSNDSKVVGVYVEEVGVHVGIDLLKGLYDSINK